MFWIVVTFIVSLRLGMEIGEREPVDCRTIGWPEDGGVQEVLDMMEE